MFKFNLKSIFYFFVIFLATGFGVSFCACWFSSRLKNLKWISIPEKWTGAGFFGTILGLIFVYWGISLNGIFGLFILVFTTLLAVYITGQAEKMFQTHDDQRIVLDEIVGFFWAAAFIPFQSFSRDSGIIILLSAFVLFRVFDVMKLPFRKAQNFIGGIGIVADDFFAGLFANLFIQIGIRWFL